MQNLFFNRLPQHALLVLLSAFPLAGTLHGQPSGPTPYPDAKNAAAWPGKGPIRQFGWMVENRKSFWTKREADKGKIVFTGDSIIGSWKLQEYFPGKPVANRGIGGDVSRGLLFRFQEDVLDLQPKAVLIKIGSNDLTADGSVADVVANQISLIDMARKSYPEMPIIVMAMQPHGIPIGAKAPNEKLAAYLEKVNANIPKLNSELAKLPATRENVHFVDTYTPFLLPDGTINPVLYAEDRVHLTDAGYSKMAEVVGKFLRDLKLL